MKKTVFFGGWGRGVVLIGLDWTIMIFLNCITLLLLRYTFADVFGKHLLFDRISVLLLSSFSLPLLWLFLWSLVRFLTCLMYTGICAAVMAPFNIMIFCTSLDLGFKLFFQLLKPFRVTFGSDDQNFAILSKLKHLTYFVHVCIKKTSFWQSFSS